MINIKNEWGSCRTCRTTYQITSVQHEATDAELTYKKSYDGMLKGLNPQNETQFKSSHL